MGKSAQDSTGFRYPDGGGNDIGVYKQPMDSPERKDMNTVYSDGDRLNESRISLGNITKSYAKTNPFGTKEMRGYGAATKGKKISGKQG